MKYALALVGLSMAMTPAFAVDCAHYLGARDSYKRVLPPGHTASLDAACDPPFSRAPADPSKGWNPAGERDRAFSPYVGMSRSEAQSSEWGPPTKINTIQSAHGTSEQWMYLSGGSVRYLILTNGKVAAVVN